MGKYINPSDMYIVAGTVVFSVIVLLVFFIRRKNPEHKINNFNSLSFTFLIMGITFAENQLLGYSLIGLGVILAVIDITKRKFNK